MKPAMSFVCPLTREDFVGEGALQHCPQCDLDIPDMTALTRAEAERVLDALRCAHELSQDLHFCSSYSTNANGDAVFFDPDAAPADGFEIPEPLIDISGVVDTTPKLLLAIAALSTLGLTAQLHVFQHILTPAWAGHEVLVLDEHGPRLEPERAHAFTQAVDASEDAWLTLNLAMWRKDAVEALGGLIPFSSPVQQKFSGANSSVSAEVEF